MKEAMPVPPTLTTLFSSQFLTPGECSALGAEMREAPSAPATAGRGGAYAVRPEIRRTNRVQVGGEWLRLIEGRLDEWMPRLSARFAVELTVRQEPQFLAYSVGHFFAPHLDCAVNPSDPGFLLNRRVSVVILVNPGDYEGGILTLHGLPAAGSTLGIPGKPGRLIAFPSWLLHEVKAITRGDRYSIACWYEGPSTKSSSS